MSAFFKLLVATALLAALMGIETASAIENNGVDDLRGRWDVSADNEGGTTALRMFVNDIVPGDDPDTFRAGGCMTTLETGKSAPLALEAAATGPATYELTILSSIVPSDESPFIVRFDGVAEVGGEAVRDDLSDGGWTRDGEMSMSWTGDHHDRLRPKCPAVDVEDDGFYFSSDVYAGVDVNGTTGAIYETYTNIVSSGVRVELPDGSSFELDPYTDLFSPFIDFATEFRFISNTEHPPAAAVGHVFTLLDPVGQAIQGAEYTDYWFGCEQGAPAGLKAEQSDGPDWILGWDADPDFEPDPEGGSFYQLGINPLQGQDVGFGASGIAVTTHVFPWESFEPGSEGLPDGQNFGDALREFPNGDYNFDVLAFAEAPADRPGTGLECFVVDSAQSLTMSKADDKVTFYTGPPPQPAGFDASAVDDFVRGFGYESGSTVAVTVHNGPGGTFVASNGAIEVDVHGNFYWDVQNQNTGAYEDINVGFEVTVAVGSETKVLVLEPLTFDVFDPLTNTISGSAEPGALVWVGGGDELIGFGVEITTAENGFWTKNLADLDPPFVLTEFMGAEARIADGDNGTVAGNPAPPEPAP